MARYTLDYQYVRTYCPNCKRKSYTHMFDLKQNEVSEFGICSHRNTCGYRNFPIKTEKQYNKSSFFEHKEIKNYSIEHFKDYQNCNFDEKQLTIIEPPSKKCLAIKNVSINELILIANKLPLTASKFDSLNVLKGIYETGKETAGNMCKKGSDILFYDIDYDSCKELNTFLANSQLRNKVKNELIDVSLFVFDSFSGRGIAGAILVSGLEKYTNAQKEEHKRIGDTLTEYLAKYLEEKTGIKVVFDKQQNKFRQVRLIPRQRNALIVNQNPNIFIFF